MHPRIRQGEGSTLSYIHAMLTELAGLAQTERHDMLAYLIEMAQIEARDILSGQRPSRIREENGNGSA